jgi:hypothetical protein
MRWRVHLRGATYGVALAVSVAAAGPALGQVPDLPDADLPALTSVTPVPVPELPPLPVPEPSVPEVPSVPVPSAPVPSAPSAPSAPSTDSVPVIGGSDGSSTGSSGGSGTSGGSTTAGGSSTSGGGPAGGAGSGAAAQTAAGGSGSRAGSRGRGERRARARGDVPSPAAIHRRERRLRRTVRENGACLTALPTAQQRVLELRAGVGPRRPHTRAGTAAILNVSRATVIQRERAGLKRLRGLDCGGSGGGAPVSGPMARGLALTEAVQQGQSSALTAPPATATAGGSETKGTATEADKGDIGVKDAVADSGSTDPQPGTIQIPTSPAEGGSGSDAMLLAAIGALTLLGFGAAAIERRRRRYLL